MPVVGPPVRLGTAENLPCRRCFSCACNKHTWHAWRCKAEAGRCVPGYNPFVFWARCSPLPSQPFMRLVAVRVLPKGRRGVADLPIVQVGKMLSMVYTGQFDSSNRQGEGFRPICYFCRISNIMLGSSSRENGPLFDLSWRRIVYSL